LPSRGQRKEIQEIKERAFPTLRRKGSSGTPAGLKVGDRVRIEGVPAPGHSDEGGRASKRVEVMMAGRRVKTSLFRDHQSCG